MDAAMTMRVICARKEAHRTQRLEGVKKRWKRLKKKEPMQNEIRETPDLIHRFDSDGAASPSPMYTVFPTEVSNCASNGDDGCHVEYTPVCMETKDPQVDIDAESRSPVMM